jgi:hypothetical protein
MEFLLKDPHRNRYIDLTMPWEVQMKPGQHVYMSMVFQRVEATRTSCPACKAENDDKPGAEIIW